MKKFEVREISFKDIYPYWKILWPNRKTTIEPSNPIQFMGSIDMDLNNVTPTLFGCFKDDEIVGVNSGIKTHKLLYRSRGIWTNEKYRLNGIGTMLLREVEKQAIRENCNYLWSMPRDSAYPFYKKYGFIRCSKWLNNYEFGSNCFILKKVF